MLDFTGPPFALRYVICITAELSPNAPAARELVGPVWQCFETDPTSSRAALRGSALHRRRRGPLSSACKRNGSVPGEGTLRHVWLRWGDLRVLALDTEAVDQGSPSTGSLIVVVAAPEVRLDLPLVIDLMIVVAAVPMAPSLMTTPSLMTLERCPRLQPGVRRPG